MGRPSDLIEQLRTRNHSASQVHEVSWKTLKSHSLDRHYPILLDVLHTFKTAVHRYHRYRQPVPVLLIELKGQAMSHQSLAFIAQQSQMVSSGEVNMTGPPVSECVLNTYLYMKPYDMYYS